MILEDPLFVLRCESLTIHESASITCLCAPQPFNDNVCLTSPRKKIDTTASAAAAARQTLQRTAGPEKIRESPELTESLLGVTHKLELLQLQRHMFAESSATGQRSAHRLNTFRHCAETRTHSDVTHSRDVT